MGYSYCRFNERNTLPGTTDNSDGEYIFPSGFANYVKKHNVKPPKEFIDKVLAKSDEPQKTKKSNWDLFFRKKKNQQKKGIRYSKNGGVYH